MDDRLDSTPWGDEKGGLPVSLIIINQSILPLVEREAEQQEEENQTGGSGAFPIQSLQQMREE